MNMENASDNVIKLDRMRYTKDKLSANLILLAIALDALYFVRLYQQDVSTYYYNWQIGASVIYNLVFLLIAFLCSESVKSRKTNMNIVLIIIGIMQFVRLTQIPAKLSVDTVSIGDVATPVITKGSLIFLIVMLIASGVLLLAAAATSYINASKLNKYLKSLEKSA